MATREIQQKFAEIRDCLTRIEVEVEACRKILRGEQVE
jgi:hypothetical protein